MVKVRWEMVIPLPLFGAPAEKRLFGMSGHYWLKHRVSERAICKEEAGRANF